MFAVSVAAAEVVVDEEQLVRRLLLATPRVGVTNLALAVRLLLILGRRTVDPV
jgi:hypothetical protein